ncbi:hypothetical protein GCM10007242_01420 [Pigmentiphaga litoralis]|nr:hypothetical protein GCM10007242_01420 [Pigmentiphaga litoralis]
MPNHHRAPSPARSGIDSSNAGTQRTRLRASLPFVLRPAWLLSLSLVFTSASGAADLGPLRVLSASGDPLRAEIEISAFTPEESTTLQVNLASADIYREAKVAYPEGLAGLTLKVADRPNGRKVVEVVSAGPVDAHVLDLLVEVTWHQGRYIRQYSFVLKSPPAEARAPAVASAAVPPTLVQPGDTLFDLATRLRPEGATVFQTLLALFHANPQSFIDGNMNLLRAGTTLQIPPAAQVLAESDTQARQTLRTQNESFALYRERVAQAAAVATPIEATPPANSSAGAIAPAPSEPAPVESQGDALKLSAQGSTATDGANPQAVRDRLEEERAATQRAIDESESRVKELTANINAMRGLLESQNQALAGMEQRANADPATDPAAPAPGADPAAAADSAAAADPAAAAAADPAADPAAADPAAADAPATDTPPAAEAAADPAAAPAPLGEDTPTSAWASEKVIALVGGLIALLAVGAAVLTLRRRARPSTRFQVNDPAREPNLAGLPVLPADSALPASTPAAAAAGGAVGGPTVGAAGATAAASAAAAAAYVASTSDDDDEYGPLEDDGPPPAHVAPIAPIDFGFDLDLDKPVEGGTPSEPLAVLPLADMVYAAGPTPSNDAAGFHVTPLSADLGAAGSVGDGAFEPRVSQAAATAPVPDGSTREALAEGFAVAAAVPLAGAAVAAGAAAATPVAAPVKAVAAPGHDDDLTAAAAASAFASGDDAAKADAATDTPAPGGAANGTSATAGSTAAGATGAATASATPSDIYDKAASSPEPSAAPLASTMPADAATSSASSAPSPAGSTGSDAAGATPEAAPAVAPKPHTRAASTAADAPVAKSAAALQAALAANAAAATAASIAGDTSAAAPGTPPATAAPSSVTTPAVAPVIPDGDTPLQPPITPDTPAAGTPVMPVVTPPATPGLLPEPTPAPVPMAPAAAPAQPAAAAPKTVLSFDTDTSTATTTSKFDLAKAYIDLGDRTAARQLLNEIVKTGDTSQKHRARDMLATL